MYSLFLNPIRHIWDVIGKHNAEYNLPLLSKRILLGYLHTNDIIYLKISWIICSSDCITENLFYINLCFIKKICNQILIILSILPKIISYYVLFLYFHYILINLLFLRLYFFVLGIFIFIS